MSSAIPQRDPFESSPAYQALVARVTATESTLASLSTQVNNLASKVQFLSDNKSTLQNASQGQANPQAQPNKGQDHRPPPNGHTGYVFSPFDTPDQTPFSLAPPDNSNQQNPSASGPDPTVQALTTQIQALSTSVAQLQRLQHGQQQRSVPFGERGGVVSGAAPNQGSSAVNLPHGMLTPGFPRPGINRSISAMSSDDKWSPHGQPPVQRLSTGPLSAGNYGWQGSGGNSMGTPGLNLPPPGIGMPVTPGGNMLITRWDQLGLKVELLRSIAKYGLGPPNKIQSRVLPFMGKPHDKDIIAQAPPTQERMLAYVVPAIQLCLTLPQQSYRGPAVIIITTTVDQASQCQKFIRGIGGPVGVRCALATGIAGNPNLPNEIAAIHHEAVQVLIGTPVKLNEIMSTGEVSGAEVRLFILDEVDQMIARNLHSNILSIAKHLPPPRRASNGALTPGAVAGTFSPNGGVTSPYDPGQASPFNPQSKTPFPGQGRFGGSSAVASAPPAGGATDRQTCFFSNTIPTDVITFSQTLGIRDPIRVMVRKEGNSNAQESVSSVSQRINVKHTYVYLAITGSARSDGAADSGGVGTIGSGRTANGGHPSEEATRAKEYKLDTLVKMLDDYPLWQAVIHVGTFAMLEAVVYKLGARQWETLYLTPDMPQGQRKQVLNQWRHSISPSGPRFLVVFDVNVKPPDIPWAPLVINFDLPRSVEGYAHRAAAAVPPPVRGNGNGNGAGGSVGWGNGSGSGGASGGVNGGNAGNGGNGPQGVIVNFVQAAGGDVEMLRSTECAYTFKCAEIPSVFHDLFQY
ncbi:hypothetical protein TREMEDRAFT_71537 [Tremella mesenterica DSM 1558]|uniref:uncharacterized protein n=1 Tax=Tremella mesenterica (strain ATCC 24925 / CBS 8224 / DSM 1558 / NBRC 9311 / NRRL Y-6157 / RJB 2259-6 / UBC 559-6) TaxID=578456 RepID=UPI0003F4A5B0|nr:uncharacterized protein TREMEDRAFT_71537 [Tremella mesenterica DSM 1558]EIW70155.1 hypothetical protein TREMEDRAFT_71537 [Tremella mesenterica DSM 1558]